VDAAVAGETVWVTNGVYLPITTTNKAITIRSVNGSAATIIDGGAADRCASLGTTASDTNSVLVGFTLRNGKASDGGGSCGGTLYRCLLTMNVASDDGGGAIYSTLNNCTIESNSASDKGGGAHRSTLNSCTIWNNTALKVGGGAGYSTLNNCTVAGNAAKRGGGTSSGTLRNCIVWGNHMPDGVGNEWYGGQFRFCCTYPLPSGDGNIAIDPRFVDIVADDFRLRADSPCLDAGDNAYVAGTTDVFGNPRIQNGTVDMGSCEGTVNGPVIVVRIVGAGVITPVGPQIVVQGGTATFSASPEPRPFLYFLTNGVFASASPTFAWSNVLTDGTLTAVFESRRHFVDAATGNDTSDGLSWATAKRTIQSAVDDALNGDEVWVTNGVYAPVATDNRTLTIRSVNGAASTVIDGGGTNRCATLGHTFPQTNSVLVGFALRGGNAGDGGGTCHGTLRNCTLSGNTATSGGGAAYSSLHACTISENIARQGGGVYYSTLDQCVLSDNIASNYGGGSSCGTLRSCTLSGNGALSGGGAYGGKLYNCILWDNRSPDNMTNEYALAALYACCASDISDWDRDGNMVANPRFVDAVGQDFRLRAGSPCVDTGNNAYVRSMTDIFGNPRIQNGTVDMGSCEGSVSGLVVVVRVTGVGGVESMDTRVVDYGGTATFSACPGPRPFTHFLTNGVFASASPTFAWSNVLTDGTLTAVFESSRHFVDAATGNDTGDGLSWATAKRTIQSATDMALAGDTVWVTNGVYGPTATDNKTLTIRSVNGAASTVIDGGGTNRCAILGSTFLQTNSAVVGFTLRNGSADRGGGVQYGTVDIGAYEHTQASVTTPVPVPYAWLRTYFPDLATESDFETSAYADADGDGDPTWQDFLQGTVPTDPSSRFLTIIDMSGGDRILTWTPDLGTSRVYRVEGRTRLTEPDWGTTNAGTRFFRVKVAMP